MRIAALLFTAAAAEFNLKEHLVKMKQSFKDSDTNGDGLLNYEELVEARRQGGWDNPEEHAKGTVKKWDANGDAHVTLEEYLDFNEPKWRNEL
mmetsp:Transcript_3884/g.5995  ORF Transcript_3884/g.5995 Transcript_3884/m.5995 type:complete len:93 (+) Transcript_3884:68-346(+)